MDGESETESPPKSAQKSESRPARKRTLGSKSAFLNAQEGAQTSGVAQKSAPMRTFTQKRSHICKALLKRGLKRGVTPKQEWGWIELYDSGSSSPRAFFSSGSGPGGSVCLCLCLCLLCACLCLCYFFLLVPPFLLILLINCQKGHKYLQQLCSALKTLKSKCHWLTEE